MSPPKVERVDARALGDAHNFGRRVVATASGIRKPRTLFWEYMLLAAKSPLRRTLDAIARDAGLPADTFAFLPDLAFTSPESPAGGEVERVDLLPLGKLTARARIELAHTVGRAIALFSFLGVADLHWENLALGRDAAGRIVFTPLDVELILADMELPTETKLLPEADPETAAVGQHACGVRRVLPFLGKPVDARVLVAVASAYRHTLDLLVRHARAIGDAFLAAPAYRTAPIRVLLRGTDEYVCARTQPATPPLLVAEAEQMARGDVPYFFRLAGAKGVHHYVDEALTRTAEVRVPSPGRLLDPARALRSSKRKTLAEEGTCTVVGAFDHPDVTGQHADGDLAVTFRARTLVVAFPDGEEITTGRNLSAYVHSVYLPCTCGEVASALVPEKTVCSDA